MIQKCSQKISRARHREAVKADSDLETCIVAFGPDRGIFESNFPPDGVSSSYAVLWNAFKRLAAGYSDDALGAARARRRGEVPDPDRRQSAAPSRLRRSAAAIRSSAQRLSLIEAGATMPPSQ